MSNRAVVLGCPVDRLNMEAAVGRCLDAVAARRPTRHVSLNVAKLVAARSDPRLRRTLEEAELVTADGQPIVWASRLLGDPLPERVAGIDLMERLLCEAAAKQLAVYVLGARHDALAEAVRRMRERHPSLQLAAHHGHFPESDDALVEDIIRRANPDILFVAMSSPRKEEWVERGRRLGLSLSMGVGGAIDVMAGRRSRAPRLLRRLGLEWLFRMAQEPRRLATRYATSNTVFLALLAKEWVLRRGGSET